MSTINGLPAHILLVHAVVVLVPLSALLLVVVTVWRAARERLVWPTALLAVVALVSVPLATEAGEWLARRVPPGPLVRAHAQIGDTLLPWAIGVALLAVAVAVRHVLVSRSVRSALAGTGRERGGVVAGPLVTVVAAVLAVVLGAGAVVTTYRIGDSGAQAAWTGRFSATPASVPGAPGVPGAPRPAEDAD